jgi:hypothetical protein
MNKYPLIMAMVRISQKGLYHIRIIGRENAIPDRINISILLRFSRMSLLLFIVLYLVCKSWPVQKKEILIR